MLPKITLQNHPLLDLRAFISHWPKQLGDLKSPNSLLGLLEFPASNAAMTPGATTKSAIRCLLRTDGFKPSGRSKPASEYLLKAMQSGRLGPDKSINPAVDACNAVSLHSALPISVVDEQLATPNYRIALSPQGSSYIFNPAGQILDIGNLLCLHDSKGPCASPVKDSQRTKTHEKTTSTITVIWGTKEDPQRTEDAYAWHLQILDFWGVTTQPFCIEPD